MGAASGIMKQLEEASPEALAAAAKELTPEQRAKILAVTKGPSSKFFAIYHTFASKEASEAWWKNMMEMKPEDQAAMHKKFAEMGYKNHFFMPEGGEKPICCVWETKEAMSRADFQAFIDGPEGPGPGVFKNRVTPCQEGATVPPSFFPDAKDGEAPKKTTGAWFWVDHTFKSKEASEKFWKMMSELKPEDWTKMYESNEAEGAWNHCFMPEGGQAQTICIWETKTDMSSEDFQKFIDGPKGPGAGEIFDNKVFKTMPEGTLPSAKFAA